MRSKEDLAAALRRDGLGQASTAERAYRQGFAGYSCVAVHTGSGKAAVRYRYIADYYRQNLAMSRSIALRALYVAIFVATALLFGSAALLPIPANSIVYVTLPQATCVALMAWQLCALAHYLPMGRWLTGTRYKKASCWLLHSSAALSAALTAETLAMAWLVLRGPSGESAVLWVSTGKYALGAALALAVFTMERRVPYKTVEKPNTQESCGKRE